MLSNKNFIYFRFSSHLSLWECNCDVLLVSNLILTSVIICTDYIILICIIEYFIIMIKGLLIEHFFILIYLKNMCNNKAVEKIICYFGRKNVWYSETLTRIYRYRNVYRLYTNGIQIVYRLCTIVFQVIIRNDGSVYFILTWS